MSNMGADQMLLGVNVGMADCLIRPPIVLGQLGHMSKPSREKCDAEDEEVMRLMSNGPNAQGPGSTDEDVLDGSNQRPNHNSSPTVQRPKSDNAIEISDQVLLIPAYEAKQSNEGEVSTHGPLVCPVGHVSKQGRELLIGDFDDQDGNYMSNGDGSNFNREEDSRRDISQLKECNSFSNVNELQVLDKEANTNHVVSVSDFPKDAALEGGV
ncbi:hypothetical protein SESBI_31622 [Sesbania bispinosa]|nr:hypothetical protein SESBI_31622 [Sesbania bispinosa]